MSYERSSRRKSPFLTLLLVLFMCGFSLYIVLGLQDSARIYSSVQSELNKPIYSGAVGEIEFPDSKGTLNIPSWSLFRPGQIWSLVSDTQSLSATYTPDNLVDLALPHGDSMQTMKIQSVVSSPLSKLFASAEAAGYPLMLSSAYRSIADQKTLYDFFVQNKGQANADMYVANPGESEHHTGLAVDISNVSDSCALSSDKCSLDFATSEWLAENAYSFGFIQRYPEGKQPITGISYEPWHYRYVGIPLAAQIQTSGLTLDEALGQMYPAFAR